MLDDLNNNTNHDAEHPVLENDYDEETSAEMITPEIDDVNTDDKHDTDINNVYGWISIALSVISFFIIPILFAGAGIIVGFIARNKDAPILGNTAIAIGVISILVRLFIMPLI